MHATVSVNGNVSGADDAVVSVFDHGFLYGDGVYETLRTYDRVPFLFERHLARLRHSAALISLDIPLADDVLQDRVIHTIASHAPADEAYIRVIVTRGVGDLGYEPSSCAEPSIVVIVKDWIDRPARERTEGISLAVVGVRRNSCESLDPRIKSNNLLNNALAMREALRRGCEEGLMLNAAGSVAECAQSSFFMVTNGALRTPPLTDGLLAGITRELVLELARSVDQPVIEASFAAEELAEADEAFVTSTTREVTSVTRIDGHPVGSGRPGPVTSRLIEAFRNRMKEHRIEREEIR